MNKRFKKADGDLNQDLDVDSEQSIRINQSEKKKRPKTAKFKESSKPGQPGTDDIAITKTRQKPITADNDIERARRKLFKKLKNDKHKQKQMINKAVKAHVK